MSEQFFGFPKQTLKFLAALEANNDREWFKAHREAYEQWVLSPARAYTTAMGERLHETFPEVHAIPMVDKSIFRMHRDTRFSPDKRPFKTHIGIFLWEGDDDKLECPGFYLHLEKDKLMLGGGIHIFSKPLLKCFREAVDDDKLGVQLARIAAKGAKDFGGDRDTDLYKRVPRGYPQDHPRADLLRKKGMSLGETVPVPSALHTEAAVDYVYERFVKIFDLHRLLLEMKTLYADPNR